MRTGGNPLLVRLVQPEGQRTRAYVAFDSEAATDGPLPSLRWFRDPRHPHYDPFPVFPAGAQWFRMQVPPGARFAHVSAIGECQAWHEGRLAMPAGCSVSVEGAFRETRFEFGSVTPGPSVLALRVETPSWSRGADCLGGPIAFSCVRGEMVPGDWCVQGLESYSGIVSYRKRFELNPEEACFSAWLDLGEVVASCEVWLNNVRVGVRIAPPWRLRIDGLLRCGSNEVEVRVANTLCNHYHGHIPTPYAPRNQMRSGLIGPVRILADRISEQEHSTND